MLPSVERQWFEEREDWTGAAWAARYDVTQVYDKDGNRTGYDKNVAGGHAGTYGINYNLTYSYSAQNNLTVATDTDDASYSCTVTCDSNMNITQIDEKDTAGLNQNHMITQFTYDALNRLVRHQNKKWLASGGNRLALQ